MDGGGEDEKWCDGLRKEGEKEEEEEEEEKAILRSGDALMKEGGS